MAIPDAEVDDGERQDSRPTCGTGRSMAKRSSGPPEIQAEGDRHGEAGIRRTDAAPDQCGTERVGPLRRERAIADFDAGHLACRVEIGRASCRERVCQYL